MNNFTRKQEIGSRTAKGGFENEKDITSKFNNYINDEQAQQWLNLMGYNTLEIQSLNAVTIPTRLKESDYTRLISPQIATQFQITQKFKKADIQVQITIKMTDGIIYRENFSLKKANSTANFNQIDKRSVDTYQSMWGFDNEIAHILKKFTGEIKPTSEEALHLKDHDGKRWFLDELPKSELEKLMNFFNLNKVLIINDIIKGRGMLSAEWFLVTKSNSNNTYEWILKNINEVINFYANGEVTLTPKGSLKIGKVTLQRKGGTPDPTSLQFKLSPLALFEI